MDAFSQSHAVCFSSRTPAEKLAPHCLDGFSEWPFTQREREESVKVAHGVVGIHEGGRLRLEKPDASWSISRIEHAEIEKYEFQNRPD